MFDRLTNKLKTIFSDFSKKGKLTEAQISDALRQVRAALLEADVNYMVVNLLVERIKEKALTLVKIPKAKPAEQLMKMVHDELITMMGSEEKPWGYHGSPMVVLLCGLQGAGKTTQAAKLARFVQKQSRGKKSIMLAACDLQRPAAVEQLQKLGEKASVPVFIEPAQKDPVKVARAALKEARLRAIDLLIIDTAGRLHLDASLMEELKAIYAEVTPHESFFVVNAAMGQDAVKTITAFQESVPLTGAIVTMLDGDARAGVVLSLLEMTKKPIRFEGTGEHLDDFALFNPRSMADRILGEGDILSLARKAEEAMHNVAGENAEADLTQKLKTASFTFNDFAQQLQVMKQVGSLKSLMKMLPSNMKAMLGDRNLDVDEARMKYTAAIISSMTQDERAVKIQLTPSRMARIAKGAGVPVKEVERVLKQFLQAKQMCKKFVSSPMFKQFSR